MAAGTGTPRVTVAVASGNLNRQIAVSDGVPALIGTASVKIGEIVTVLSYEDAVFKGYTPEAEPSLNAQIKQFYDELGGNMPLTVMGVEDTMTMAQMCTASNANGLKKLLNARNGQITLVGVCRQPSELYEPGENFLDQDVNAALLAAKPLAQYQQSINRPIRILIEGRVVDISAEVYEPSQAANTYAGVVLGNDKPDYGAAVGTALARACKFPAHVKLGNGQNGALALTAAYIGEKPLEEFYPEELDVFQDAGYILLTRREGAAGYYFGVDRMAGNDDFNILVHGRLIDKAHRITAATANPLLETTVRITPEGTINATDAAYLEDKIRTQLLFGLADQVSGVDVIVPTDQDVINTSTGGIVVKIQPLGYLTWIAVTLGLTQTL